MNTSKAPQTILFLAANPKGTDPLRLGQELRDIGEGLKRAQKRDQFNLAQRSAVRPRDIQRAMNDLRPQIVHFSGHGAGEAGLVFEDEIGNAKMVDGDALAALFELFADRLNCVVLNGCYSQVQAQAISQYIPYVIGMNKAIGDKAAIAFAVGFYDGLGAGRDVEFAFKSGCVAIRLEGIAEHLTPVLIKKPIVPGDALQIHQNSQPPNQDQKLKLEYLRKNKLAELESDKQKLERQIKTVLPHDILTKNALEHQLYLLFEKIGQVKQEIQELEQDNG
jgi:CHAT domain